MSGPDVFLSYNHPDAPRAQQFAEALEAEGFSVWWDATLRSGETFDEVIERALLNSQAVVVLWSPSSVTSRWVRAEATEADRMGKLVPVTIAPCKRPIVFEMTQTADLSHWQGDRTDKAWRAFVADVSHVVKRERAGAPIVASNPAHSPPYTAPARGPDRRMFIAAALVAALAVAGWLFFRPGVTTKLTDQPVQIASFTVQGGAPAALLAETMKNTSLEVLGNSEFRTRPVEAPEGKRGLAIKGSIIADGNRMTIFVQLEHLPSGETVWSKQFERDAAEPDLLATAAAVATAESLGSLRDAELQDGLQLEPDEIAGFIDGSNMVSNGRPEDTGKPLKIFEDLVGRLPGSAHAHAMLAISIDAGLGPAEARKAALARKKEEVAQAIRIDPKAAGAAFDVRFGIAGREMPSRLDVQEDLLLDGLSRAPDFPYLHMRECDVLMTVGRIEDAKPYCQRANAMRPTAAPISWRAAWVQELAGKPGLADQAIAKSLRYYPDAISILATEFLLAVARGESERLIPTMEVLRHVYPEYGATEAAAVDAFVKARRSGLSADAASAATAIVTSQQSGSLALDHAVLMLAALDRKDTLQELLRSGDISWQQRSGKTVLYHPLLAPIRKDPAFWDAAMRLHLIEYWRKRGVWPDFCGTEMPLAQCKAMATAAE